VPILTTAAGYQRSVFRVGVSPTDQPRAALSKPLQPIHRIIAFLFEILTISPSLATGKGMRRFANDGGSPALTPQLARIEVASVFAAAVFATPLGQGQL
jgi:hypothetical protein